MEDKNQLARSIATNQSSFFVNPSSAAALNPFDFNHHGNNYRVNTSATSNEEPVMKIFQAIASQILNSACGNVTGVAQIPSNWSSVILRNILGKTIEIAREASQHVHEEFEDCVNELTTLEIERGTKKDTPPTNNGDSEIVTALAVTLSLVVLGVLAVFALIAYKKYYGRRELYANLDITDNDASLTPGSNAFI